MCNGDAARLCDRQQALRPIPAHPGQQDSDGAVPMYTRRRLEGDVDRRPMPLYRGRRRDHESALLIQLQVLPLDGEIDGAGRRRLARLGNFHLYLTATRQPLDQSL